MGVWQPGCHQPRLCCEPVACHFSEHLWVCVGYLSSSSCGCKPQYQVQLLFCVRSSLNHSYSCSLAASAGACVTLPVLLQVQLQELQQALLLVQLQVLLQVLLQALL